MSNPSADRLNQLTTELSTLLESRLLELTTAMKAAESTTRQVVSTEMEIGRYRHVVETLEAESGGLQKEAATLRTQVEEARTRFATSASERDRLRAELIRLADQEDELRREVAKMRGEQRSLEESLARLDRVKSESAAALGELRGKLAGK